MQAPSGDPIRANLATHAQEAIRSQLIAAGHAFSFLRMAGSCSAGASVQRGWQVAA